MYSVYMKDNKNIIYNKQEQNKSTLTSGDIIKGEILGFKDNKASIKLQDKVIETKKSNIEGNVGDIIDFEVTKNKDGIQLKQLGKKEFAIEEQNKKVKYNKSLLEKDNRDNLEVEEKSILKEEVERKIEIANLKRKIKANYKDIDKKVVKELISEGADIGKMTIGFIEDIKSELYQNDISKMESSEIISTLENSNIEEEDYKEISLSFKNNGLDFVHNNIEVIGTALEKFEDIKENIEDVNIAYAIKDNKLLTINNLYSGKNILTNDLKLDMTEEVKLFLSKNNIEVSDKNINSALYLVSNNIEVNKDNIDKVNFAMWELKDLKKTKLINAFVKNLQKDIIPVNVDLISINEEIKELHKTNLNIIKDLNNITDENIAYIQDNNIDFTLSNLVYNKENTSNSNLSEESLLLRKQLIEIQLKLTSEVSFALSNKGIEIDTVPLKKVLDEIKAIENNMYIKTLENKSVEFNDDNLKNVSEVFDKLKLFEHRTNSIYKKIVTGEINFNLNNVSDEIFANKLAKQYEENQTIVNPKFKDSFNKVREQISPLLNSLNIESNDLNIKASSILIKNKMDITQENIDKVLLVDSKMDKLLTELQPDVVVKMLKNNINPLTTNIDDLLSYTKSYNEEEGILNTEKESIVKNIIKLEKDKSISKEELEVIKSVYRAINQSIRNEGVGIGAFINSNHDLTIANLLDSYKYVNKTKGSNNYIDKEVSDDKGIVDNSNRSEESLKNQVQNQLNNYLLQGIVKENSIGFIKQLSNKENTIKSLFDKSFSSEITDEEVLQNIEKIKNSNVDKIHNYLLEKNIPVTTYNVEVVKELFNDSLSQTKKLRELVNKNNKIKNKLYDVTKNDLENTIDKDNVLLEIIEEVVNEDIDFEVKELVLQEELLRSLKYQDEFNKSNPNEYELPVLLPLSSEVTNLKMFLPDKNALNNNELEVLFALNTGVLGDLEIKLDYFDKERAINIEMNSGNKEALEKIELDKDNLIENLKSLGIEKVNFKVI